MTPRKRQDRVYWRRRSGTRRAYGDFRDYADVGGKLEPLIPPGEAYATTDPDVALRLALRRLDELDAARKRRVLTGTAQVITLAVYSRDYLVAKRRSGKVTTAWLEACQAFLERAVTFFGADRPLDGIRVSDVRGWSAHLLATTSARRRPFSADTVRRHLFTLSNLYRFAAEEELVPPGFNPVSAFSDKPARSQKEAKWLETPDAALLLESARTIPVVTTAAGESIGPDLIYPLVAAFLCTGGRRGEVLGLELEDVSLDRQTITFRPNGWRPRLKTRTSWRVVPMVPQLVDILKAYLDPFGPRVRRGGTLLFPSFATGEEQPLQEIRRLLDRVAIRCGWTPREISARVLRHTFCASRLQTLDQGAPVSLYTVSREMGHGSQDMVQRVYAHLGAVRHRAEVLEYRVEQHTEALKDRLGAMGFVTQYVTQVTAAPEKDEASPNLTFEEASSYDEWARRESNARPFAPEANALSS